MNYMVLARTFYNNIESQRFDELEEMMSDNFSFEGPVPYPIRKDEFVPMIKQLMNGLTELNYEVYGLRVNEEKVSGYIKINATLTGTLDLSSLDGPIIKSNKKRITLPADEFELIFIDGKIDTVYSKPSEEGGLKGLLEGLAEGDEQII